MLPTQLPGLVKTVSAAAKARIVLDTNAVLSALLFTHGRLNWLVAIGSRELRTAPFSFNGS